MRRLVLLLALAAGPAHAQAVRLHVLADSVFVGERFSLAVSVDHLDGTTVAFPEVPAGDPEAGPLLAFGDAEILSMRRLPPRLDDRARTDSVVYEAATFALDSALVGPVTVRLSSARDTTTLVSPVVPLRVRSTVPTGTQEPRPPAPPDPFPVAIGPWLLLGLLAAALVVLAVFLWRKRQDRMPPAVLLAPYDEALRRLDALDRAEVGTAEEVKAHYVALSDLVRGYLARSLAVPALERTTSELAPTLTADPRVPPNAGDALVRVLREADLAKFADLRPDAEARAAARARTRDALGRLEAALNPPVEEEASEPAA